MEEEEYTLQKSLHEHHCPWVIHLTLVLKNYIENNDVTVLAFVSSRFPCFNFIYPSTEQFIKYPVTFDNFRICTMKFFFSEDEW